ncbi:hypothetical protein BB559_003475 [Furculomyces boomerangus]|uniref:asparagine--tRNA ligase n=2 Tax=Harpellales TaxID=61421 RepID=A0A2T9YF24_9FUNG|nr:hypothetical protein BB559_004388 [Furculomyces boomerangus]PVU93045.1 hypothetical protein BB559_003475 [Furculomyces boomerangus]PWA01455.1 hypothetical protein BB558_002466 [Smittium angustum]
MDKLKDKINSIRLEAEAASARADAAEMALKQLNDQQTEREHEINSLTNRVSMLEEELERKDAKIAETKQLVEDNENSKNAGDTLSKRIHMLEEKLEEAELELQQTKEKLRNMDIKADTLERTVAQMENERNDFERKHEELNEKYIKIKEEHEETIKALEDLSLKLLPTTNQKLFKSLHLFPLRKYTTQNKKALLNSLTPTIKDVLNTKVGSEVEISGWVRSFRKQKRIAFAKLHDGSSQDSLQVVFDPESCELPKEISFGSAVRVWGTISSSMGGEQSIELQASKILVEGSTDPSYPFQKKYQTPEFTRNYEHLRPKLELFNTIMRIRNQAEHEIHSFYTDNQFTKIHTPILVQNDCEGAGETFSIEQPQNPFFDSRTNLTVSAQLHLEAACSAHNRVYTFNPAFRAETGITNRHLAEFWMVEAELCFVDNVDRLMDIIEANVSTPINKIVNKMQKELDFLSKFYNVPDLIVKLDKYSSTDFVRISYKEAIEILQLAQSNGTSFQFPPKFGNSLQSEHELYLTNTHFNQTPVFVYNYPKEIKAFYMKPNPDNSTVACIDLLFPGIAELAGGSVRDNDHDSIKSRMVSSNPLATSQLDWYFDLRKFGSAPHSGYGIGFDRFVQLLTGSKSIRDVIMFPRYFDHIKC